MSRIYGITVSYGRSNYRKKITKYYNDINELNHTKKYDYCFIGNINSCYDRRIWVIDFAKKNFTNNSIFINTDDNPKWELLGSFDYSKINVGFSPILQHDKQSKKLNIV